MQKFRALNGVNCNGTRTQGKGALLEAEMKETLLFVGMGGENL